MPEQQSSSLSPLEWATIVAIVTIWGVNNAAAKVATEVLPPLFVAGARFALTLVCLAPFIRPPFPEPRRLALIVLLLGPLHFGVLYTGFALAHDLSPLAVALQLWIPFTALFGWLLLGERLSLAAGAGMAIAFVGVAWMTLDGGAARDLKAIGFGAASSAIWAIGTVLVRKTPGIKPFKLQGLAALVAAPVLLTASFATEPDLGRKIAAATPLAWACVVFAGLASSVVATGLMFWLVQRREAGRVAGYFLLSPLVTCAIGALFLGDRLTLNVIIGAASTMSGVALVALSERRAAARSAAPAAAASRKAI